MFKHHCCYSEHNYCHGCYKACACLGSFLTPILLLGLRLLFGILFIYAGLSKFADVKATTDFFGSVGLPSSTLLAYFVGLVEIVGGAMLALGFATRFAALALLIVLLVAIVFVHHAAYEKIFVDPSSLLVEQSFGFLVATLVIFCFGPGVLSLDYLLERYVCKNKCCEK